MSEQQTRIEITGNIEVHHPVKTETGYQDWFSKEWDRIASPELQASYRLHQLGYWNTEETA